MTLVAGSRLGSYEIEAQIGEGGMGEVYRATDTKLDREVAIKVLPAAFTEDPERLARFEREAKLLAQLHHPHIASIFGLEESEGIQALVMELVEGPTLDERMAQGDLEQGEILEIGRQIAEALEEAHEKGIIHRDLKPQNVKLTPDGKVKVLDFGLAKAMDPVAALSGAGSASQLAASPTLTLGATAQGVILGTAAYMSPEQAAGNVADRRSDIWSFGAVLYEMLTGKRLFEGETISHLLAGVLKDEPDFEALPDDLPPRILRLLQRCLRKKPRERLQAIGDARLVIEEVLAGAVDTVTAAAGEPNAGARRSPWPLRIVAAIFAFSTLALSFLLLQGPRSAPKVVRSSILPPPETSFFVGGARPGPVTLSPDGRQIAFTGSASDSRRSLWVRAIDSLEARELQGTEDARYPFWSPDSKQIAYFDSSHLNKIALAGGPPVKLALASNGKGGTWNREGVIVFSPDQASPIFMVPSSGGEVRSLTTLKEDAGESSHRHPRFLPDGKHFLFIARLAGHAEARIGALDGLAEETIFPIDANVEYASGHLLFMRDSTLMAQRFDSSSRQLAGEALPIATGILRIHEAFLAVFTVSSEGSLAYQTGSSSNERLLVWRDREGNELGRLSEVDNQRHARLAPDGLSVATTISGDSGGGTDIWIIETERGLRSRFTFDPEYDSMPIWFPDGQQLAFSSNRDGGTTALWVAPIAGTEPPRRITKYHRNLNPQSWSPDGELIVAEAQGGGSRADLVLVSFASGEISPLIATEFDESSGEISPDGRWLAYRSNETGRDEVFVTSFPTPGRKWQVSQGEGTNPVWRSNGRELFFRDSRGVSVAEVDGSGTNFEVGSVRHLFDLPLRFSSSRQYDVTPDGQRFLVNEPFGKTDDSPVTLVQNWDVDLPNP